MSFWSLFGPGSKIKEALRHGATIIDVRSAGSYDQGKIRNSFNIPLDRIPINLERIRHMRRPIIVCSDSGSESDKAIALLKANGIPGILNGGSWTHLLKVIQSL